MLFSNQTEREAVGVDLNNTPIHDSTPVRKESVGAQDEAFFFPFPLLSHEKELGEK